MRQGVRSILTVLALVFLAGATSAQEVTRFPIAGLLVEVPVAEGFCAATEADMRNTALKRILSQEMVARTRPLALHLDCPGLTRFREGGLPETLRARYWSLVVTAPDSLLFNADHLATYEAMLAGLSNPTARQLFGKNLAVGVQKTGFKPSSIVVEMQERSIGGTILAEVSALDRWYDLDMGMAVLPVRSRLILTAAIETANASEDGADFAQAFDMLTQIREAQ
jgi:hypothetical protein